MPGLTTDEILAEIAESGWLINNLFQLSDGTWRANLRTEEYVTHFGEGPTPAIALDEALVSVNSALKIHQPAITHSVEAKLSLADLIRVHTSSVQPAKIKRRL